MNFPVRVYHPVKRIEKTCQYPGCGELYIGAPNTHYCIFHSSRANRVRLTHKPNPFKLNQALDHLCNGIHEIECALKGCKNKFIIEKGQQRLFSRYCEEHRSEYKRNMFLTKHVLIKDNI